MDISSQRLTSSTHHPQPEAYRAIGTGADYQWFLDRFTNTAWTPQKASVEQSETGTGEGFTLSVSLKHESGSHIQCQPVDPTDHLKDVAELDHHPYVLALDRTTVDNWLVLERS